MKKRLSLLLAAVMVVSMLPVAAFAKTDNSVTRVPTVTSTGKINNVDLVIEEKKANSPWGTEKFMLTLENGVWQDEVKDAKLTGTSLPEAPMAFTYAVVDDSSIIVTVTGTGAEDKLFIPMKAKASAAGDVKVVIDPLSSQITGGSYVIANALGGATKSTVAKVIDATEGANTIKNIVITETAPGSLEPGKLKLRLVGPYTFPSSVTPTVSVVDGNVAIAATATRVDSTTLEINVSAKSTAASMVVVQGIQVSTNDAIEAGDVAEIIVSGANATKETLEVAKFVDYGYTWKAENKDVPVVYAGTFVDADDVLEVTFQETVANSWLEDRKTQITVPAGVKIVGVTASSEENITGPSYTVNASGSKVTVDATSTSTTGKVKFKLAFDLSIEAGYTGPVDVTIKGSGVSNVETSATIAEVVAPVTVTTEINEVKIDYRNVPVNDIVITEYAPGALAKGATIALEAEEMQFEDGIKYAVTGDLKVQSLDVTGGWILLEIKTDSVKEAATITLSNIQLYLDRTLPTGDYDLFFRPMGNTTYTAATPAPATLNTNEPSDAIYRNWVNDDTDKKYFETDDVVAVDNFVKVITAARDQDDSLFTTKVAVTIGAFELVAGEKVIPLDVPAYISAAGYTMMPLRGVTEALSDKAIISWDDATKSVTIIFGSRVIGMVSGSNVMKINGTDVPMSAKLEIVGGRSFVPLRDLGIALGVNEDLIAWDDATKTASLN